MVKVFVRVPLIVIAVLMTLSVGSAQAAPGWGTASTLSPDNCRTYYPGIVAVGAADAAAIWMRDDPCGQTSYSQQAASLAGGAWSSSTTMRAAFPASVASMVADGLGTVWATWVEFDTGTQTKSLVVARRDANGTWGAPAVLDSAGNDSMDVAAIDANASGAVIILWGKDVGGSAVSHAYRYTPGGVWSSGVAVSATGTETTGQLVLLDDAGRATAVWSRATGSSPATYQVQARIADAAGTWGATHDFGPTNRAALPGNLEQRADGSVTYLSIVDLQATPRTLTIHRRTSGDWDQGTLVSGTDNVGFDDSTSPDLAVRADGSAVVLWVNVVDPNTGPFIVRSARSTAEGAWESARTLSGNAEGAVLPKIATDAVGNDLAMWVQSPVLGDPLALAASRAALGGDWAPIPAPTSDVATGYFELAISGDGRAQVVFQEIVTTGVWERIRGISWTPPAPRLTERPRLRGTVRVGQTLRVSDGSWSEVATVEHRWQRCMDGIRYRCRTVSGATGSTYQVTNADRGYALRVVSRATGAGGASGFVATPMTRTFSKLTIRRVAVGRNGVRVRVRVSGAGRIDVRGTIGAGRRAACARVVRVKRAGLATLTCRLRPGVRARLAGRSPSVRVVVTYRPNRGVVRRAARNVVVGPISAVR